MRLTLWKRFSYALSLTILGAFAAAYTATVHARDVRIVQLRDDCDQATFDAAVGPGTCVGDGDTLFADFLAEFDAQGSVDEWRFNPDNSEADSGVQARNRGGETHTFTEVARFGDGFVTRLNSSSNPEDALPECAARNAQGKVIPIPGTPLLVPADAANASAVPAGKLGTTMMLKKGTHRFQCCIHPWMRSTIKIE
jgi:hypothetical protein